MRLFVPVLALLFCTTAPACNGPGGGEATGQPSSEGSSTGDETTGGSTTGPDPTTSTTAEGTTTDTTVTTGGSTTTTTGATEFECDVWTQDCPPGLKCAAWANDGTEHWNATRCVPVDDDPAQPGEPCLLQDSVASGIDNCAKGSFCWYINYMTLEGVCIPSCTGSPDAWTCPDDRHCDISNNGTLLLCLQKCDPLVQSCPEGQICFGSIDGTQFICDSGNVGMLGMYGDPCAFINSCAYGLFCAFPEDVPGCDNGDGCCSEYCDTSMGNTCSGAADGQQCVTYFAEGTAPPGLEDVGACIVPQ